MSDAARRTALITGANTGLGRSTAAALARLGWRVFFACRSSRKTQPVIDALAQETGNADLHFLPLDLGDLASVRECARQFLARGEPLHVLVANAGGYGTPGLTKQGFEPTFGVCHLGHFLLVQALRPALEAGAPARVVVVASRAHERVKALDLSRLQRPGASLIAMREYGVAKLCNVLFVKEAARRWGPDKVHFYALHPGVVASDIWRALPWPLRPLATLGMLTPEQGCRASVHCATSPEVAAHTGRYYGEDGAERRCNPLADDPALAAKLWEQSEVWTGPPRARPPG